MSSRRKTALVFMTHFLRWLHNAPFLNAAFACGNQEVVKGFTHKLQHQLCHHRQAIMNLYMEYWKQSKCINIKNEWVKDHHEMGESWGALEEFMIFKMNVHTTLSIWCDHRASDWMVQAWIGGIASRMMGHTHMPPCHLESCGETWEGDYRMLSSWYLSTIYKA